MPYRSNRCWSCLDVRLEMSTNESLMSTKTRKNQHLMASHRILQYTLITLRFILVAFPASGAAIPSHSNSINMCRFFFGRWSHNFWGHCRERSVVVGDSIGLQSLYILKDNRLLQDHPGFRVVEPHWENDRKLMKIVWQIDSFRHATVEMLQHQQLSVFVMLVGIWPLFRCKHLHTCGSCGRLTLWSFRIISSHCHRCPYSTQYCWSRQGLWDLWASNHPRRPSHAFTQALKQIPIDVGIPHPHGHHCRHYHLPLCSIRNRCQRVSVINGSDM